MRTNALSYAFVVLALIAGLAKAQVSDSPLGAFPFLSLVLLSIGGAAVTRGARLAHEETRREKALAAKPFSLSISEPAIESMTNKVLGAVKSGFGLFFESRCKGDWRICRSG